MPEVIWFLFVGRFSVANLHKQNKFSNFFHETVNMTKELEISVPREMMYLPINICCPNLSIYYCVVIINDFLIDSFVFLEIHY